MARVLVGLLTVLFLSAGVFADINIDANDEGRVFEGVGALSAGASTRLLIDYPEPQRSQILDYLFKPNYGAGLQHLKVEIGSGGTNSTCGTEPSHALTRDEFDNPIPEYYDRGYEWWLMREAKSRNPDIILDSLQWGAPHWLGNGQFYSQDTADYIVKFIQGAYDYHGLTIDYTGIWNERPYDPAWIKLLRNTLDSNGLADVKIVAADEYDQNWTLVDAMEADQELKDAIHAVGVHYPSWWGYTSTQAAKDCGKPLWDSENWNSSGVWPGPLYLARIINKDYVIGKMTKVEVWSPISSYSDNLPWARSGLMLAQTPWSGYYDVEPAIWGMAHYTQFAQPGWIYIEGGCGLISGGSHITLKKPDGSGHYSIIIETSEATSSQTLNFNISGGLSTGVLHVWRSNASDQFIQISDITPVGGSFSITLNPGSIYSLTTTTGQRKGDEGTPLPKADFPVPYSDDFESYGLYKQAKYFSDMGGSFEVASRTDGSGKCLRQAVANKGIQWGDTPYPETIIGTLNLTDYEVSSDVYIENSGYVGIMGRFNTYAGGADPADAYLLKVNQDGYWEFMIGENVAASGTVAFSANTWHSMKLKFIGTSIIALIDNVELLSIFDPTYNSGMAGLASGWNNARFDNFSIQPYSGPNPCPECVNLALGKTATASSQWDGNYSADKANDGDIATRWNSAASDTIGAWLEIDFGADTKFNKTVLKQYDLRISGYKIQYWNGSAWVDAHVGGTVGEIKSDQFDAVTAQKVRLYVTSVIGGYSPSIFEFEVYYDSDNSVNNVFNQLYKGDRNDFTGRVGYSFQANQTFDIFALGRPVNPLYNGGVLQADHVIELFNASTGTLLADAVINAGSEIDKLGYAFEALDSPVTVTSGQEYIILSDENVGDGDPWLDLSNVTNYKQEYMSILGGEFSYSGAGSPVGSPGHIYGSNSAYLAPTFYSGLIDVEPDPQLIEEDFTFTSSFDGVGPLYARAVYMSGSDNLPLMIVQHGYDGTRENVMYSARRMAENGYFCVAVDTRGWGGSAGAHDDGGVEIMDIYDAIEESKQAYGTLIDVDRVSIIGYSNGGNVFFSVVRFPYTFRASMALFGIPNYGQWIDLVSTFRDSVIAAVGGSPEAVPDKYMARNATLAAGNLSGTRFHIAYDVEETLCPPVMDEDFVAAVPQSQQANVFV